MAFDAVRHGTEQEVDVVLIDTAGRLHTKTGLMDELGKVKRVIEKQSPVDEVLLVIDATTGQNGLVQATVFAEVVDVTGVVLTKLDGTAKGGIVIAVQRALGVPVKLVGLGEGPDDLAPFDPGAFADALLGPAPAEPRALVEESSSADAAQREVDERRGAGWVHRDVGHHGAEHEQRGHPLERDPPRHVGAHLAALDGPLEHELARGPRGHAARPSTSRRRAARGTTP